MVESNREKMNQAGRSSISVGRRATPAAGLAEDVEGFQFVQRFLQLLLGLASGTDRFLAGDQGVAIRRPGWRRGGRW
jgi:hypothetical protein